MAGLRVCDSSASTSCERGTCRTPAVGRGGIVISPTASRDRTSPCPGNLATGISGDMPCAMCGCRSEGWPGGPSTGTSCEPHPDNRTSACLSPCGPHEEERGDLRTTPKTWQCVTRCPRGAELKRTSEPKLSSSPSQQPQWACVSCPSVLDEDMYGYIWGGGERGVRGAGKTLLCKTDQASSCDCFDEGVVGWKFWKCGGWHSDEGQQTVPAQLSPNITHPTPDGLCENGMVGPMSTPGGPLQCFGCPADTFKTTYYPFTSRTLWALERTSSGIKCVETCVGEKHGMGYPGSFESRRIQGVEPSILSCAAPDQVS